MVPGLKAGGRGGQECLQKGWECGSAGFLSGLSSCLLWGRQW